MNTTRIMAQMTKDSLKYYKIDCETILEGMTYVISTNLKYILFFTDLMAECLHYRYGNVVKTRSATAAGLDILYPTNQGKQTQVH